MSIYERIQQRALKICLELVRSATPEAIASMSVEEFLEEWPREIVEQQVPQRINATQFAELIYERPRLLSMDISFDPACTAKDAIVEALVESIFLENHRYLVAASMALGMRRAGSVERDSEWSMPGLPR